MAQTKVWKNLCCQLDIRVISEPGTGISSAPDPLTHDPSTFGTGKLCCEANDAGPTKGKISLPHRNCKQSSCTKYCAQLLQLARCCNSPHPYPERVNLLPRAILERGVCFSKFGHSNWHPQMRERRARGSRINDSHALKQYCGMKEREKWLIRATHQRIACQIIHCRDRRYRSSLEKLCYMGRRSKLAKNITEIYAIGNGICNIALNVYHTFIQCIPN